MLPIALGIGGAALLGAGFVVQQHEAAQVASDDGFSVSLLFGLMRRRLWWLGIGSMVAGYVLVGWSLGDGNLVLVEPLVAANLIFALPIAAKWCGRWPQLRTMAGAVMLAAGVTGFVIAAQPNGGRSTAIPASTWLLAGGAAAVVVLGAVAAAWRRHGDGRAMLLGVATGTVYGMQDGLTRTTFGTFSHAGIGAFASWPVWTLVVVGALGVLLAQNAFDCAPITSSLPAISLLEPAVGIVLGITVFDSHLRTAWPALVVAGVSLVVMLAGALLVSRAPVVRDATMPGSAPAQQRKAA